jgi:hypothetical protein
MEHEIGSTGVRRGATNLAYEREIKPVPCVGRTDGACWA